MKKSANISQKAIEAFSLLENNSRISASPGFHSEVMKKIASEKYDAFIPIQPLWKQTLKYVAILAITVLNGILLYEVYSSDAFSADLDASGLSTTVEEYFPDYITLSE